MEPIFITILTFLWLREFARRRALQAAVDAYRAEMVATREPDELPQRWLAPPHHETPFDKQLPADKMCWSSDELTAFRTGGGECHK